MVSKYIKAFRESCEKLEEIAVYGSRGQRGISKPGWGYRYIPHTHEINIYKDGKIIATIDDNEDPQVWIEQHKKESCEKLEEDYTTGNDNMDNLFDIVEDMKNKYPYYEYDQKLNNMILNVNQSLKSINQYAMQLYNNKNQQEVNNNQVNSGRHIEL